MSELEKEIEKLISEKKRAKKSFTKIIIEDSNQLVSPEDMIAAKELSAKIARQKRDKIAAEISAIFSDEEIKPSEVKLEVIKNVESDKLNVPYISKINLIDQLRTAKVAHKRQMAFIHILVETNNFHEIKATYPVNYTNCNFGKWFCKEGLILASFKEYMEIELAHQKIHDYYLKIYNLYKTKIKSSLFKNENYLIKERDKKIKLNWIILKEQSSLFFDKVLSLENKIKSLSSQEIDKLNLV